MARKEKPAYKRIKGSAKNLIGSSKLYYNDQHLLFVDTGLVKETYRKVAFADICGLSITKTKRTAIVGTVFAAIAFIFLLLAFFDDFSSPVLWIIGTFFALIGVINGSKGACCSCHISTAYSLLRVKSIKRHRAAIKFKILLDEIIRPIQGSLTAESVAQKEEALKNSQKAVELADRRGDESVEADGLGGGEDFDSPEPFETEENTTSNSSLTDAAPAAPPPIPLLKPPGAMHFAFPVLFMFLSLFSFIGYSGSVVGFSLAGVFFAMSLFFPVFVLARSRSYTHGKGFRTAAITSIVYLILIAIAAYVFWMIGFVRNGETDQFGNPKVPFETMLVDMGVLLLINGICSIILSLWAFLTVGTKRK